MKELKNAKQKLFRTLGLVQGDHKSLLDFLIRTFDDLDRFVGEFLQKSENLFCCIQKFRLYKQEIIGSTKEGFVKLYETNKKLAVEGLFQQPATQAQIKLISVYEPTMIYEEFKKNTSHTILSLYRSMKSVKNKVSSDSDALYLI